MSSKKGELDYADILEKAKAQLKSIQKKTCRRCKKQGRIYESGFCEECFKLNAKEREERKKESRLTDDNGYVRIYHPETGKLVLEHRYIMEKELGRPLQKGEVVLHRDGNNSNNERSNLMLGFKSGTPFEHLVCSCGLRGQVTYDPQSS